MRTVSSWNAGLAAALLFISAQARAQTNPAGGVWVDSSGMLRSRQLDAADELAQMRRRAAGAAEASKDGKVAFVSLSKSLADLRAAQEFDQAMPQTARYLGGMTQLRYVLVYPDRKDIVLAGPCEPVDATQSPAVGRRTGRPVLHIDDLIVALRTGQSPTRGAFGCSIDLPNDAMRKFGQVLQNSATTPRAQLVEQAKRAIGPQAVRFFGASPDTRLALACVSADLKLKRMFMGMDRCPLADVGHAIEHNPLGSNRFWFETLYDPMLVSRDSLAYEFRGQRLAVKAGKQDFDPRDATPTAQAFAKRFNQNLPTLATAIPAFADLQNVADLSLLAALIRQDRLDRKAGLDLSWALSESACRVAKVPVARTVDTLVCVTGPSLVAGGVTISASQWVSPSARQIDEKGVLTAVREQGER